MQGRKINQVWGYKVLEDKGCSFEYIAQGWFLCGGDTSAMTLSEGMEHVMIWG